MVNMFGEMELNTAPGQVLGDKLAFMLRLRIVQGRYARNERLVENQVASEFDLSRASVRDALRILEREGLVRNERGYYVNGVDRRFITELLDIRELLEHFLVKNCLSRFTAQDTRRLKKFAQGLTIASEHNRPEDFARNDINLHDTLFTRCGHRRLRKLWSDIRDLSETILYFSIAEQFEREDDAIEKLAAIHTAFVKALAEGDREQALRLNEQHFAVGQKVLAGQLGGTGD